VDNERIKEQYAVYSGVADIFRRVMVEQIETILLKNNLTLGVPIESRVKALSSIINRDKRKPLSIDSINELDDFIGIRLILLFSRDVDQVLLCLKDNFVILKEENKSDELDEDKFGYQSYHYIVRPPVEWLKVPSFSHFDGFKIEVQVRTLSQHIWAASSHKLQYKKEQNVPLPLRRAIHRVSALLEVVDLEFERVLAERAGYVDKLSNEVQLNRDATLDVDLLKMIASNELPDKNKSDKEDFDDLHSELIFNNITTVGSLLDNLKKGLKEAIAEDKRVAERLLSDGKAFDESNDNEKARAKQGVYFSRVGLIRLSMNNALGDSYIINSSGEEGDE